MEMLEANSNIHCRITHIHTHLGIRPRSKCFDVFLSLRVLFRVPSFHTASSISAEKSVASSYVSSWVTAGGINLATALLPLAHDPQSMVVTPILSRQRSPVQIRRRQVVTPILSRQWSPVQIMLQPFFSSLHHHPPSPPSHVFVYSSTAMPTSRNKYALFIFLCISSFPLINRNGWLGVKPQVTSICTCVNRHITENGTPGPSGCFTGNAINMGLGKVSRFSRFYWAFCPWGLESEITFSHDIPYEQVHEFY